MCVRVDGFLWRAASSHLHALVGWPRNRLNFCIAHRTRCSSMRASDGIQLASGRRLRSTVSEPPFRALMAPARLARSVALRRFEVPVSDLFADRLFRVGAHRW